MIYRSMRHLRLYENFQSNAIEAYHRSDADFESFDLDNTETGLGMNRLGWGMYFSENKNLNPKYGGILYEVILDPGKKKWLDEYMTEEETLELLQALGHPEEISKIFQGFDRQRGKKLTTDIISHLVLGYFNRSSYGEFGKDFALFLVDNGYVGRKVKYCEEGEWTCIIVFDTSIIQIVDKTS